MKFFASIALLVLMASSCWAQELNARVFLAGKSPVSGSLNLTESAAAGGVRIIGRVTGLTPGNHGFHVHQFGDVFTNGCDSTGPHYNPRKALHGAPHDNADQRHAGDLGNIVADAKGVALINLVDTVVSLSGPESILGRAFVVHAAEDDLGRVENEGSTKTGNAGARLACGIIAIVP
ncbi:copper zinc superoxide disumtase 1 [Daphnia pulex]|uniref:Superoxide dismutase [Cu-Zn] n=1 Tax=Daphnia pulex TaxID=6669 RepID=E9GNX8_DAPPU|nr:copper zinc superoxide disumtase 1 [Daphnia pulex]|eukprot:EFX78829.1 copper zinc superoxide disumtase 1 [Daphnia pulex]